MTNVDEMERRMAEIPCPICRKTAYQIDPRTNPSSIGIIYTAVCTACRYSFPLNILTKPVHEVDPDLEQVLKSTYCPKCEERGVELNFRCSPSVRDAYRFITCTHCKHPFFEETPMEAFE